MLKTTIFLLSFCSFITIAAPLRAEDVEMVTFYPSPDGVYRNLRTTQDTSLATDAGNVGIGTSNPNFSLGLRRAADGSSVFTQYTQDGTGATANDGLLVGVGVAEEAIFLNRENTNMIFSTNNTEQLRITNTGNVGIGTAAPASRLTVAGSGNGRAQIGATGCGADYVGLTLGQTNAPVCSNYNLLSSPSDQNLYLNRPLNSGIFFRYNNAEQMHLSDAGNLGIGFVNAAQRLQVNGDIAIGDLAGDAHLRIVDTGGNYDRVLLRQAGTNDIYFGDIDANNGRLIFRTNALDRVTIAANNGFMGIGTMTPQNVLDVEGGSVIGAGYSGAIGAPTNGLLVEGRVGIGDTTPDATLDVAGDIASDGSVTAGSITASGTIRSISGGFVFPDGVAQTRAFPKTVTTYGPYSNTNNSTYDLNLGTHKFCMVASYGNWSGNNNCSVFPQTGLWSSGTWPFMPPVGNNPPTNRVATHDISGNLVIAWYLSAWASPGTTSSTCAAVCLD